MYMQKLFVIYIYYGQNRWRNPISRVNDTRAYQQYVFKFMDFNFNYINSVIYCIYTAITRLADIAHLVKTVLKDRE